MKAFQLTILFLASIYFCDAQTSTKAIKDHTLPFKTTGVAIQDFQPKEVLNAYDLALNLSYMHTLSSNLKGDELILPVVTVNDKPYPANELKKIENSAIEDYEFKSGETIKALYGTRGQYGYLAITTTNKKQ